MQRITRARLYFEADPYGLGDDELGGWWLMAWFDGQPREPIEISGLPAESHGEDIADCLVATLDCYGVDVDPDDVEQSGDGVEWTATSRAHVPA